MTKQLNKKQAAYVQTAIRSGGTFDGAALWFKLLEDLKTEEKDTMDAAETLLSLSKETGHSGATLCSYLIDAHQAYESVTPKSVNADALDLLINWLNDPANDEVNRNEIQLQSSAGKLALKHFQEDDEEFKLDQHVADKSAKKARKTNWVDDETDVDHDDDSEKTEEEAYKATSPPGAPKKLKQKRLNRNLAIDLTDD